MDVSCLTDTLADAGIRFFTGVPDSRLQPLCDYLMDTYGLSDHHLIAPNEGSAAAIAAGLHLATGEVPCVYCQNSGLGNLINPAASLLNNHVYGIPCLFIVGWRGEPGVPDEPQHAFQGQITLELLAVMDIPYLVIDQNTAPDTLKNKLTEFKALFAAGRSAALVVQKGGLSHREAAVYANANPMRREDIIRRIVTAAGRDIIVATTGKTSRELFEIRERSGQSHRNDFLTVGSMGHASSLALGIALSKPRTRVWCIDGDGAALMHLGALALIGARGPANFVHVVINNGAHESVGGQPTAAAQVNFGQIALACGYRRSYLSASLTGLDSVLSQIQSEPGPIFLEARSAIGSRRGLGRPVTTPAQNKAAFMAYLRECQ